MGQFPQDAPTCQGVLDVVFAKVPFEIAQSWTRVGMCRQMRPLEQLGGVFPTNHDRIQNHPLFFNTAFSKRNWASKQYVPLDMMLICIFYVGSPGHSCTKDDTTGEEVGRLRWPTSRAVL